MELAIPSTRDHASRSRLIGMTNFTLFHFPFKNACRILLRKFHLCFQLLSWKQA